MASRHGQGETGNIRLSRAEGNAFRHGATWSQWMVSHGRTATGHLQGTHLLSLHSQKDYVCFDFVARHQNVIRYRKGQPMITDKFATVCAWAMFNSDQEWKYDILIGEFLASRARCTNSCFCVSVISFPVTQ